MEILHLNNNNFDQVLRDTGKTVIVEFWARWCGPCKQFAPVLEQAAELLKDRAVLAKVDIDESKTLAARFGIPAVPTLIAFRNGAEVNRITGIVPKERIAAMI